MWRCLSKHVISIYQFIMIFYNYSTFKYWNTFIRYAIILPVARLQVMEKTDCRPLLSPIKMFQITVSKPRISQLTKSTQVHIIPPHFLLKTLPSHHMISRKMNSEFSLTFKSIRIYLFSNFVCICKSDWYQYWRKSIGYQNSYR